MGEFRRDPNHWLFKLSPDEWIRASLGELHRAESAWEKGDRRAGTAGVKRAAGMALNAAVIVEPEKAWGRTYVEHLAALESDEHVPAAVRSACRRVLDARPPGGELVSLRMPHDREGEAVLEAARDVIAHAWAVAKRHDP